MLRSKKELHIERIVRAQDKAKELSQLPNDTIFFKWVVLKASETGLVISDLLN